MELDFPHPRQAERAGMRKADYSALVASATSRQTISRTVSALLSAPHVDTGNLDTLDLRIAFFARQGGNKAMPTRGAFWVSCLHENQKPTQNSESAVNLAGSINRNSDQSLTIQPETQVTERGTELWK